jgi:hypothetical protein
MDPKAKAELDQSLALMRDILPTQWRALYVRLVEEGFREDQALDLLKTFITATSSGKGV